MNAPVSATEADFDSAIATGKPTLIDFWAEWCGPCKKVAPILDRIAAEHPEFAIVKVDVDAAPALAQRYGVTGVPRIIVLDADGNPTADFVGAKPKRALVEQLEKA